MSSAINTLLVLGGTSGIGEAFVRRWHAQGKKIIVSGRRQDRLDQLKSEMPGLEAYAMDISDLAAIPRHVDAILAAYPDLDSVWINAGSMKGAKFADPASTDDASVLAEIALNASAPTILARYFIPYLNNRAEGGTFLVTSSGTGFAPNPIFPVYCATKAYVHSLMVGLRQQLKGSKVNVIEIVPPLVNTGLGVGNAAAGKIQSMSLEDYTAQTFEILDGGKPGELKEVTVGTGVPRVQAWREGTGRYLESVGLGDS